MKQKFRDAYMKVAETFAELSSARRLHVGAIVVKEDRIISIGYNGMPAGWDNDCEDKEYMSVDAGSWLDPNEIYEQWPFEEEPKIQWFGDDPITVTNRYKLKTKPEVLHAETNAIAKLAKSNESGNGATMFVTHAPCLDCAKLIFQSGINSVLYRNSYRSDDGINFLAKAGVTVEKLNKPEF
jgi:dCMP deaminase